MAVKKKSKKKLVRGGIYLDQNQLPIQQGFPTQELVRDTGSTAGAVGGGMAKGAAAGAAMGPVGMIAGAAIGGITGAIGRQKEKQAIDQMNQQIASQNTANAFRNAGKGMKHGGKLASKLGVVGGGELNQISPDAVEVNANNPQATDSVELNDAFVDHGEVIDNQNRVFSEELGFAKIAKKLEKMKSNNSRFKDSNDRIEQKLDELFAEQESMKTNNLQIALKARKAFGGPLETEPKTGGVKEEKIMFNSPAEAKAYYKKKSIEGLSPEDKLFYDGILSGKNTNIDADSFLAMRNPTPLNLKDYVIPQEAGPMGNVLGRAYGLKEGGYILRKKLNPNRKQPEKGDKPIEIKGPTPLGAEVNYFLKGKKKMGTGGQFDDLDMLNPEATKVETTGYSTDLNAFSNPLGVAPQATPTWKPGMFGQPAAAGGGNSFNMDTAVKIGSFIPNVVNAFQQRKLKGPADPRMENNINLARVNPREQLARATRSYNQATRTVTANTAGAGNLTSAMGSLLSKRLQAENEIYGNVQEKNIGIGNQEAAINTGIKGRNVERTNAFNQNKADFANRKLMMTSENIANAVQKGQIMNREANEMKLDKEKYGILQQRYADLPADMKSKYPNIWDYYNSPDYKGGKALGGYYTKKLSKRKGGKMC